MENKKRVLLRGMLILVAVVTFLFFSMSFSTAQTTEEKTCIVYFTGVGCPHCAKTDPVLINLLKENPKLVIIEYEIYQQQENAPLLLEYDKKYGSGFGIPLVILGKENYIIGDRPILNNLDKITKLNKNPCPLIDSSEKFENLDLTTLPGKPKIWSNERILIKTNGGNNNELLKNLLTSTNLSYTIDEIPYKVVEPAPVALSGKNIYFENAIQLKGWLFQWNGKSIETSKCPSCPNPSEWSECINGTKTRTNYKCGKETNYQCIAYTEIAECQVGMKESLTLAKIVSLAAVDAVNPCALAVLTLMLIAILTYNPKKKRNILLAGLAFTTSVFIMYLIYGLVIIRFFQLVQALTSIRLWLYKILGFAAIILGSLNIRDFVRYKPGGFATEMPLSMRPKVKKLISGVTSPRGAFFVGIFVTVFLLPCTIGPYVIASGILSSLELIKTIPPLLLYNIIFVLPMLGITLIVYAGFAKVEDVSGWKEKNIKYLHLVAGIIMFFLGIAMVLGWV